jgi:transposase
METKILDNLGLVAQMYDELEIGTTIDSLIKQDREKRNITVGQAVKAMVLNGLGFVNQQLYLVPSYFETKPVEHLFGDGFCAEYFNDDALGRALDSLFDFGLTPLFCQLSSQAMRKLDIVPSFGHLDSTTFHVDGKYDVNMGYCVSITKGYSRDHRPELNQVGLALIVEQSSKIPFLMKPLSGNSNDNVAFREIIKEFGEQLRDVEGVETFVADCALCSKENIQLMQDSKVHFVTRMPATSKLVKGLVEDAVSDLENLGEIEIGYKGYEKKIEVWGHNLRAVVLRSSEAAERLRGRTEKTIEKAIFKEQKLFKTLQKKQFACEEDTEKAIADFEKQLQYTQLKDVWAGGKPVYSKPGRPSQAAENDPDDFYWRVEGECVLCEELLETELQKKGWFVLLTNQMDEESWTAQRLLSTYKSQGAVEQGFRFLKSPEFLCDSLYLKNPSRIEALLFVMTLCLLVYSALEHCIRKTLQSEEPFWPDQLGKPTNRPTARWIFQNFHGIHVLDLNGQKHVLNKKPHHEKLLEMMGNSWKQRYG